MRATWLVPWLASRLHAPALTDRPLSPKLALTSQDKEPQAAIKHLQAVLAIPSLSHPDAVELARSARRRLTSLQTRLSRGPSAAPAQSPSSPRFLDPRTASPRAALGKAPAGLPLPRRLRPDQPTASVSTTHTFASASLSLGSPSSSAHGSLPSPRSRHASAPPGSGSSAVGLAGSSFNPHADHSADGFTSRMRRATSTFSNMTANSINSLSPSLFSLKLQDERSDQAPCLVDDLLVHGQTAGPSSRSSGSSTWGWFGRKSVAEGSLRNLASASGRVASPQTMRVPIPRATKSSRPPVPSSFKPPRVAVDSAPPSPAASGLTTPSNGGPETGGSGLQTPTFKTRASDHGDKTLDPQLRLLEMSSKVTRMAACSVCGTEGVNLPECPRCRLLFCSRGCRIGEDAAGDGKLVVPPSTPARMAKPASTDHSPCRTLLLQETHLRRAGEASRGCCLRYQSMSYIPSTPPKAAFRDPARHSSTDRHR
jgi:hypothetical protein